MEREERHRKSAEKKAQAAVRQSLPPSMVLADALPPLARAPISKPPTKLPPAAQQLAGQARSFQAANKIARDFTMKQQEWQAQKQAAATRKMMKTEKEEQWRRLMEDGAFKTQAGKEQLINRFKAILDKHKRCEMMRNEILLGHAQPDPRVCSKCYDDHMAGIREGCTKENMFQVLIENYEDFDYYSMDTD